LRDFAGCEAPAMDRDRASRRNARDVPLFVAGLPIFSRAYYGKRRSESTLDIPLGSGPYQVGRFEGRTSGRRVELVGAIWWRAARTTSTPCATSIIATATSASKASPPSTCFARSSPRAFGRRAIFCHQDARVRRDVIPDDTPSGRRCWFINAAGEIRMEIARGADLCLRLRMDQ
jgi:microcin C transport system substrate-binding protein